MLSLRIKGSQPRDPLLIPPRLPGGSRARSSLGLLIDGSLGPTPVYLLTFGASQVPGTRRCSPPWPHVHGSIIHSSNRVTHGVRRKKTDSSTGFKGSGVFRPMHQPLKPASFATKKPQEGAPCGDWSKPTEPDT